MRYESVRLCSWGVPQAEVVRALLLLRDAPCTTGLHEKAHKPGALLHRQHKLYGPALLSARSMVLQVAPLFRDAKPNEPTEVKLRLQVTKAKAKAKSVYYTARNHYCKRLISEMTQGASAGTLAIRKRVIASHSKLFDRLHPEEQRIYREQAEREKRGRVEQLDFGVDRSAKNLRAHIAAKQDEESKETDFGIRNVVDALRLHQVEIDEVDNLYQRDCLEGCLARQLDLAARGEPDLAVRAAIECAAEKVTGKDIVCAWWCQLVVAYRESDRACAICTSWKGAAISPTRRIW